MNRQHSIRALPLILSFALFLGLPGSTLAAGIYKWVDEQGNVQYGDKPGGHQATKLKIKQKSAAPKVEDEGEEATEGEATAETEGEQEVETELQKQQRRLEELAERRAEKKALAEQKKEARAQRKEDCKTAKYDLQRLDRSRYVYGYDNDGKIEARPESVREAGIQKARKDIKKFCK